MLGLILAHYTSGLLPAHHVIGSTGVDCHIQQLLDNLWSLQVGSDEEEDADDVSDLMPEERRSNKVEHYHPLRFFVTSSCCIENMSNCFVITGSGSNILPRLNC